MGTMDAAGCIVSTKRRFVVRGDRRVITAVRLYACSQTVRWATFTRLIAHMPPDRSTLIPEGHGLSLPFAPARDSVIHV
jgi:hypothetical protein